MNQFMLSGEIIQMTSEGIKPVAMVARPNPVSMPAFCIFEYVYFARPDSVFEGTDTCFVASISAAYIVYVMYCNEDCTCTPFFRKKHALILLAIS